MHFTIRKIVFGLTLAALSARGWAAEPPSPEITGKVLILENTRTLEGDISRVVGQYRIRRGASELSIPVKEGMYLFPSWPEAFKFMASQANLRDPDERLRLARWCQVNGLYEQGLKEVRAALEMRPGHRESRQLQEILQRTLDRAKKAGPLTPVAATVPSSLPPSALDISAESMTLFTIRVQAVLMNTCVSCHTLDRGGNFHLVRSWEGGAQGATRKNLAAVLPYINPQQPELSPLLIKAVSDHGNVGSPPMKNRQSAPYRILETWVDQLLASNPQLKQQSAPAAPAAVAAPRGPAPRDVPVFPAVLPGPAGFKLAPRPVPIEAEPKSAKNNRPSEPRLLPFNPSDIPLLTPRPANQKEAARTQARPTPGSPEQPTSFSQAATITPSRTSEPTDPFDPAPFNQLVHPNR